MIKNYYDKGKVIFYKNKVKGVVYTGILPVEYKEDFLNLNIIRESDIYENFKIINMVQDKYYDYFPKENT